MTAQASQRLTSKRSPEPSASPNRSRPGAIVCTRRPNHHPNRCPSHCPNPNSDPRPQHWHSRPLRRQDPSPGQPRPPQAPDDANHLGAKPILRRPHASPHANPRRATHLQRPRRDESRHSEPGPCRCVGGDQRRAQSCDDQCNQCFPQHDDLPSLKRRRQNRRRSRWFPDGIIAGWGIRVIPELCFGDCSRQSIPRHIPLQILQPRCGARIGRRPPIAARRQRAAG